MMKKLLADLILEHGKIVDVFSGEIREGDVAVLDGRILGISTDHAAREVIDIQGAFILPGLIDAHVHIESSMTSPEEFARMVVLHGTTSVIADPHEIANVCGTAGIDYMLHASKHALIDIRFMLPSCVPSMQGEHNGATLGADDLAPYIDREEILGLGEFMDVPGVLEMRADVAAKLQLAKRANKVVDGHSPGLNGPDLQAYAAAGILTDHECSTVEEMRERIASGMYVMLREGSAAKDLMNLLPGVNFLNMHRCMFCTDDKHAEDIIHGGHIDLHLRRCVQAGMDPIAAVRMASLHPALCYGLRSKGAIAPGFDADIIIVNDLESFSVRDVFVGGEQVVKDSVIVSVQKTYPIDTVTNTCSVGPVSVNDLAVTLPEGRARVIELNPGSLITGQVFREIPCDPDGTPRFEASDGRFAKIAVFERHRSLGTIGIGIVEGFGISGGAIATTISHDAHNIIVIGDDDLDMVLAVQRVIQNQGGIAVYMRGERIGECRLPIAGLMSDKSGVEVSVEVEQIRRAAYDRLKVSKDYDPIMTLSFLALAVIPELKVTDQGLYDVTQGKYVDLAVNHDTHRP